MIFHHLHQKMPIYKECTLAELLIVAISNLAGLTITFALLTELFFSMLWIGYLIAALLVVPATRIFLGYLQKVKYGKPFGYYHQLFLKRLQSMPIVNQVLLLPFITRLGRWGVRRP